MRTGEDSNQPLAIFPVVDAGADDAEALTAILRRLNSARSLAEVMAVSTHAGRILLDADGVTFVLREGDQCYYADEDAIGPLWKGRRFLIDSCISGWCMVHDKCVAIPDITQDPRYGNNAPHHGMPEGHLPVKSYLAVPVVSRSGEVLGGLFFGHSVPQPGHTAAQYGSPLKRPSIGWSLPDDVAIDAD